jgi:peptidoglycan/xylan/chitin deacetylase (PgdA/CDA1 family)
MSSGLVNMSIRTENNSWLRKKGTPRVWPSPWKSACYRGVYASGILWGLRTSSRYFEWGHGQRALIPRLHRVEPKYVVLCYHRIGTGGVPLYNELLPLHFEAQIAYIRKHYRVISVAQLARELRSGGGRGQTVVVTFDDGYRDLYRHAYPVLRKYEIPATIYLTAGSVDSGEIAWYDRIFLSLALYREDHLELRLGDELCYFTLLSAADRIEAGTRIITHLRSRPEAERADLCAWLEAKSPLSKQAVCGHMLSWEQVRDMRRGGIDFGPHTVTNRVLGRLLPEEQEYELQESKKIIERMLEAEVLDFAYPFGKPGDCGDSNLAVVRSGYRSAMTISDGVNVTGTDPFRIRRVQIGQVGSVATFACLLAQLFFQSGKPLGARPEAGGATAGRFHSGELASGILNSGSGLESEVKRAL